MTHLLEHHTDVQPVLAGRPTAPAARGHRLGARLTFAQRATRSGRFPLEQALARKPEPSRIGRHLDIEA